MRSTRSSVAAAYLRRLDSAIKKPAVIDRRYRNQRVIPRLRGALLCVCLLLCLSVAAIAQPIYAENQIPARGVEISYEVMIRNPASHLYDVEMLIKGIRETSISVSMPAWSPGVYRIENYARNVQDFRAVNARNQSLKWEQTDKQTWRIAKQAADDVTVRYQVYSTLLNDQMADVAPPATFMYVVGQKHVACSVKYAAPGGWKVYTGLEKRGDRYVATDYDIFIDAPAFIGDFKVLEFEAGGANHYLVFSKRDVSLSAPQMTADMRDIVDAATSVFGKLPYKEYFFLFKVQPVGGNAVEHLNSTRIVVGENDFVTQSRYREVLATAAHEFVHLWNVKRIRPAALGPFDYTREVHTKLLWMFEGITSYYGDLLLARAGIDTPTEYLSRMAVIIDSHEHTPGRRLMSAEEASWNAWLRSDNLDNNTISYYTKGELIGLLLDIEIRARTKNQKSLDDVMRYLLETYASKGVGFPEDGFLNALETVAGSDFDEFFEAAVRGRQELDYNRYLKQAGLAAEVQLQPATIYVGISFEPAEGNLPRITRVVPNSPAERARLDIGDVLVAMNDERLSFENFRSRLHSHSIGETIKLTVLRSQRLLNLNIVPTEFQEERWQLNEVARPTSEQIQIKNSWLGTK
jgi:predicted metalloprotease with PDZ domain